MLTAFKNSSINSNIVKGTVVTNPDLEDKPRRRHQCANENAQIEFPVQIIKSDMANKPLRGVNNYTANTKTIVQNIFNERNHNENLNFKNTFYLEERDELANKEANTIYNPTPIYAKTVVEADLKAEYTGKVWKDLHIQSEKKARQGVLKATTNATKFREQEAKTYKEESTKHDKEVRRYFKRVQNLVGVMVGAIQPNETTTEKIHQPYDNDETNQINIAHIQKETHDEEAILNNRANIRTLMGVKSVENQQKLQAEKEEKEKLAAEEEAERARIARMEEMRISKYLDLKKLSQTWRIYDKTRLKEAIRNEIMKDIMKEEERKNFVQIAKNMKKTTSSESPKKSLVRKNTKKIEPPKAWSPRKKANKSEKKYTFSPDKVQKLPGENQEEFKTRFNFTVMALAHQKEAFNPVEQHKITKKFQELLVKKGMEKNGKVVLDSKR